MKIDTLKVGVRCRLRPWGLGAIQMIVIALCLVVPPTAHADPIDNAGLLPKLLESTTTSALAGQMDEAALRRVLSDNDRQTPIWPLTTFLVAEIYRLRGDLTTADRLYREMLNWAGADPYHDGWGGQGLVAIALWRALCLADQDKSPAPGPVKELFALYGKLKNSRLFTAMVEAPEGGTLLATLPVILEDIRLRMSYSALALDDRSSAVSYFLDYLKVASNPELDARGQALMKMVMESGLSADRVTLLWAKRLYVLKKYDAASALLTPLQDSSDQTVACEAAFYLAKILQKRKGSHSQIISLLSFVVDHAADPEIAQQALFERGTVYAREGSQRNIALYRADFLRLLEEFPLGRLHDDALYHLAGFYQSEGDYQKALEFYERLQVYQGANDWQDSAYFRPAIIHYQMGGRQHLETAADLLSKLNTARPLGPLYLNALFWLGRTEEELGNKENADRYFKKVIDLMPYDYYGVRARVHLNAGASANRLFWPDPETDRELQRLFTESRAEPAIGSNSAYEARLRSSLATGLYQMAYKHVDVLRRKMPSTRIEHLSIEDLEANDFTGLCLLLALRQDALAAKDVAQGTDHKLGISSKVASSTGDWPLALLLGLSEDESLERRSRTQNDKRYLASVYPPAFRDLIKKAADQYRVEPAVLYSIIRRESLFDPSALSANEALGLYQFFPSTFRALNKRWGLLEAAGLQSREEYLMDPARSIFLGAHWLKQELLQRYHGELLFSLMDHNAGYPAVRAWRKVWESEGRDADLEYMVETIRFGQTRGFVRKVLADAAIVRAAGIF